MDDKTNKRNKLAADILRLSRNTLLVNLRFMDSALNQLQPVATGGQFAQQTFEGKNRSNARGITRDKNLTDSATPHARIGSSVTLASDGETLFYTPLWVLKTYKDEQNAIVRAYLHAILHCVFKHMFVHTLVDRDLWDLACDIAVEYVIDGLSLPSLSVKKEVYQRQVYSELQKELKQLTAEKIYHYYREKKLTDMELKVLRGAFAADDHVLWYMTEEQKSIMLGRKSDGKGDGDAQNDRSGEGSITVNAALEERWGEIARRMQMDMESFSKMQGDKAGNMMQNLRAVNRERYDYTAFLKKFAVLGEAMKINDDEFDYIYYTYGLQLYDKMPLIEPLEYKEVKRIREFVIAIDTSGSVSGDLVQKFIQKTYNILQSTESFFSKINVHIIQCDAEIQEDAKITSQKNFDRYLNNMKLRGLGGTDFRPVFEYVDGLREKKEFQNLKGLIYFTDGYGTFPAKKPPYETAFVFIDDGMNNYDVPPWAIKLVLQKEGI